MRPSLQHGFQNGRLFKNGVFAFRSPLKHNVYQGQSTLRARGMTWRIPSLVFRDGAVFQAGSPCRPSPMSCAHGTIGDLNADVQNYLSLTVAASTRKTYSSGERTFIDFCTLHSLHKSTPIPTNEETLIQYVAYLASTIKHSSIKGYLAAVRHLHSGYELDLRNCPACS